MEESSKALTVIQANEFNEGKKARSNDAYDFAISKEMIVLLKRQPVCIRLLIGKPPKEVQQPRKNNEGR